MVVLSIIGIWHTLTFFLVMPVMQSSLSLRSSTTHWRGTCMAENWVLLLDFAWQWWGPAPCSEISVCEQPLASPFGGRAPPRADWRGEPRLGGSPEILVKKFSPSPDRAWVISFLGIVTLSQLSSLFRETVRFCLSGVQKLSRFYPGLI